MKKSHVMSAQEEEEDEKKKNKEKGRKMLPIAMLLKENLLEDEI